MDDRVCGCLFLGNVYVCIFVFYIFLILYIFNNLKMANNKLVWRHIILGSTFIFSPFAAADVELEERQNGDSTVNCFPPCDSNDIQ
jgi:hypothetical protein